MNQPAPIPVLALARRWFLAGLVTAMIPGTMLLAADAQKFSGDSDWHDAAFEHIAPGALAETRHVKTGCEVQKTGRDEWLFDNQWQRLTFRFRATDPAQRTLVYVSLLPNQKPTATGVLGARGAGLKSHAVRPLGAGIPGVSGEAEARGPPTSARAA